MVLEAMVLSTVSGVLLGWSVGRTFGRVVVVDNGDKWRDRPSRTRLARVLRSCRAVPLIARDKSAIFLLCGSVDAARAVASELEKYGVSASGVSR